MRSVDQLAEVVKLACLTDDLTDEEHHVLIAVALRVDMQRGSFASSNFRGDAVPIEPCLVDAVVHERDDLTGAQRKSYERLLAKWVRCQRCALPLGMHGPDGCET